MFPCEHVAAVAREQGWLLRDTISGFWEWAFSWRYSIHAVLAAANDPRSQLMPVNLHELPSTNNVTGPGMVPRTLRPIPQHTIVALHSRGTVAYMH